MNQTYYFPKEKLQEVVDFAWDNPHSDLYRTHWRKNGITQRPLLHSPEDFYTIPPIRREDFTEIKNPLERVFVPHTHIRALRSTSGTSGRGPFYFMSASFPRDFSWYKEAGTKKLMTFSSQHYFSRVALAGKKADITMFCGDAKQLPKTFDIIARADIDTLIITPSLALTIEKELRLRDLHHQIKVIALWGEACSTYTYTLLQSAYPSTRFLFEYAFAEANDTIGKSTDRCTDPHTHKHLNTDAFFADIYEEELLVTTLELPHALPLVRYQSGDRARWHTTQCACSNSSPLFLIEGRIKGDFVRISGGEFRTEELERVLRAFQDEIDPVFQMHIHHTNKNTLDVILLFVPRTNGEEATALLSTKIKRALLEDFRLSPTFHLKDALERKNIHSLRITPVEHIDLAIKNPRIVYTEYA